MARQYVDVSERDLGAGIDQFSAENQLQPGFSERLTNVDPLPEGQLRKRKGYQGHAGYLPVRAQQVVATASDDQLCFVLDDSVDLLTVRANPLLVYGRTSVYDTATYGGDLDTTNTLNYYATFTADPRESLAVDPITIDGSVHGHETALLFVGLTESTAEAELDNNVVFPDEVTIDTANYDITLEQSATSSGTAYVYTSKKTASSGRVFVGSDGGAGTTHTVSAGATDTFTITAAQHSLDNFQIVPEFYIDETTDYRKIIPDNMEIATNGDVSVTLTNDTGADIDVFAILSAVDAANVATGVASTGTSTTVNIPNITSPFAFVGCYLEQTLGGVRELVLPDAISYDEASEVLSVTFVNDTGSTANFEVYYEFGAVNANELCVTSDTDITSDYTDTSPQITLWGLNHADIYGSLAGDRAGWVTHIDSYRNQAVSRLVSALGGNLFHTLTRTEAGTTYGMPLLYSNLRTRVLSDTSIAPAFAPTSSGVTRTAGLVEGDTVADGWAVVSSVSYNSGTGYTEYTLSFPSKVITGVLSSAVSTSDQLTVKDMGWSRLNGTFQVKGVTDGVDEIVVAVDNPSVTDSVWDETDAGGLAGVFTDSFSCTTSESPFIPGDVLDSDLFEDEDIITVTAVSGTSTTLSGVLDQIDLPLGLRVVGERTSRVWSLRDSAGTADVTNLVPGDMVSVVNVTRQPRAVRVNANADESVTIAGDGVDATVTVADTSSFAVGEWVLFRQTETYYGTQQITEIVDSTTFTFESTETASESATLVGKTVQFDESFLWRGSTDNSEFLTVPTRWIPVEAPDSNDTVVTHFDANDYDEQPTLRSVSAAGNMYITGQDDEVFKYDSTEVYQAGLPRWQAGIFANRTDVGSGAMGTSANLGIEYTAIVSASNQIQLDKDQQELLEAGQQYEDEDTGTIITVSEVSDDGTNYYAKIVEDISGLGTGGNDTLRPVLAYNYYFRLNAVDANDNIIVSAPVGSANDFVMRTGQLSNFQFKIINFPSFHFYDYDRLEVEVYRTAGSPVVAPPYFRVATIALSDESDAFVFTDRTADETLTELDFVSTSVLGELGAGTELGTGWDHPMRAKYATSVANRLVLANLKDYQQLDLQLVADRNEELELDDFSNDKFTFRRDNTDTSTVTDMTNTAVYEFVGFGRRTVSTPVDDSGFLNFTLSGTITADPGDWVYLFWETAADDNDLTYAGWYQVITGGTTVSTLTVNAPFVAGATVPDSVCFASDLSDIPIWTGTGSTIGEDGNYNMLNGNAPVSTTVSLAARKLANAINMTMRVTGTGLSGYDDFVPWLSGNAGNEFAAGQVVVRQTKQEDTTFELELPSSTLNYQVFVDGIARADSEQVSSSTGIYPSRLIASYENYPELFDSPRSTVPALSDSVIDVNPADGQEITGVIPFFGDSAFGGSQKSNVLVVFKTNSVYLVDLGQKAAGQDPVQRLETHGLGCTVPYSIAVSKSGIVFANNSGVYRINRSLGVEFLGRYVDRIWREEYDLDEAKLVGYGHHNPQTRVYKLSMPAEGASANSNVLVYNHTRENYSQLGIGSWTEYDNHPVTGWANLERNEYWGSTTGQVFVDRSAGDVTDYRDDASGVSATILYRAMDFGSAMQRKSVKAFRGHYRTRITTDDTEVSAATNLRDVFSTLDSFQLNYVVEDSGVDDSSNQKIITLRHTLPTRQLSYLQLQYVNSEADEPFELCGLDFKVAGMGVKGTEEARDTI